MSLTRNLGFMVLGFRATYQSEGQQMPDFFEIKRSLMWTLFGCDVLCRVPPPFLLNPTCQDYWKKFHTVRFANAKSWRPGSDSKAESS